MKATIQFKDDDGDLESFDADGTYTYDKKSVIIKVSNDREGLDETWSGEVDKKMMTLKVVMPNWDVDKQVKFTKQ